MKLFVVTDGEYSDYTLLGIYSTKDKAELCHALHNAMNIIEEWELDAIPEHPPGLLPFSVAMDIDGKAWASREGVSILTGRSFDSAPYGDGWRVNFWMWAKDETHAIKIANERRVQLIANNEWNTDWERWRKLQTLKNL